MPEMARNDAPSLVNLNRLIHLIHTFRIDNALELQALSELFPLFIGVYGLSRLLFLAKPKESKDASRFRGRLRGLIEDFLVKRFH